MGLRHSPQWRRGRDSSPITRPRRARVGLLRRIPLAIAVASLIAATLIAPASAAPHCSPGQEPEFVFGFAHLKTLLGDKMGDPIECEHANPENGDTLQSTTTGLAFYRKSTNTPTFTNGWDHWAWTAEGLVYWTGSAVDPPGSAAPVSPSEPEPSPDQIDRAISAGFGILEARQGQVPGLAEVLITLREVRDRISFSVLPEDELGRYEIETRSIVLSNTLTGEPAEVVAAVLAHEGQHALDHNLGRIPGKPLACFDAEVRAFDIQTALWQVIWGSQGMPAPVSNVQFDFNRMLEIKQESPITHVNTVVEIYGDQCGEILSATHFPQLKGTPAADR